MILSRLPIVALLVFSGAAIAMAQPTDKRSITVQGQASTDVSPDMATISIGVTTRAPQATAALDANSTAARRVIDHAKRSGVAPADVKTGSVTLTEAFKTRPGPDGRQEPDGYIATNILVLKLRDLSRMGVLLRETVDEGANRISGVRFGLNDAEPVKDAMRKEAVADARRKALLLAEAAGAKMGEVLTIAEAQGYQPFEAAADIAARRSAANVPVESGLLTVTAEVTVTWALE